MSEDRNYLPVLKIPCRIARNPAYFTKYLPEVEEREINNSRASNVSSLKPKIQLPTLIGKGVKKPDEVRKKTHSYETAYGETFIVRQLMERQLDIGDLADAYLKVCPNQPKQHVPSDFYKYKAKVKRPYVLWEPKKDIKYFQGQVDKRLVEAKQRINKSWKQEMKEHFKKEKRTEQTLMRKAESMDKGLKAYLKKVDKDLKKYQNDSNIAELQKLNAMDKVKKSRVARKTKRASVISPDLDCFSLDALHNA